MKTSMTTLHALSCVPDDFQDLVGVLIFLHVCHVFARFFKVLYVYAIDIFLSSNVHNIHV
jgi:hypothetical protein